MEKTIKDYTIELNGLIIGFVRDYITKTKSRYKLTDEEMSNIIGLDIEAYNNLMNNRIEDFDGNISSGLISTIYIISGGRFNLNEIAGNMELDGSLLEKEVEKLKDSKRQEKVRKLFEYLQIDSDEKLDEFLENFSAITKIINDKEELLGWLNGK